MKTFKKFLTEKYSQMLVEASLSRIVRSIDNEETSVGMITAFRGEYDYKQNQKRNVALEREIRSNGYGYNRIVGKWVENEGTPEEKDVYEETFFIRASGDQSSSDKLKKNLMAWCKKYSQEGALFKPGKSNKMFFLDASGSLSALGEMGVNQIKKYMSIVAKKIKKAQKGVETLSKFHFESVETPKNISALLKDSLSK